MNIQNILATAEKLSSLPNNEYDQSEYSHGCGTPSCIAGHAVALVVENDQSFVRTFFEEKLYAFLPKKITYKFIDDNKSWFIRRIAKKWLGIDHQTSEILFTEDPSKFAGPEMPLPRQAAAVLTTLANEGHVDWSKAWEK